MTANRTVLEIVFVDHCTPKIQHGFLGEHPEVKESYIS